MSVTVEHIMRSMQRLGRARPRRRGGRLPKWLYPSSVEREYFRLLFGLAQELIELTDKELIQQLESLTQERNMMRPRLDAWTDRIRTIRNRLALLFSKAAEQRHRQVGAVAVNVSKFNREQLNKTARAALGVEVLLREEWLRDELASFSAQNVDLITSIQERYLTSVESVVQQGMRQGMRPEEIAKRVREVGKVTKRRARFIARDQVAKLNGQLTELRQNEVGVRRYRWRTSLDERVREKHARREGKIYRWRDPPDGGHPGFEYNCRCIAEPVLEDLIS